ncbi:hypothetical protein Leryth_022751 [Lithospermum erythrorhizon]|nr:hypothetical protein Leryth_022751 [Lithospermum erythrorhizon]
MKTFEQHLRPDIFADINKALGELQNTFRLDNNPHRDNANNSSRRINDQIHVQSFGFWIKIKGGCFCW